MLKVISRSAFDLQIGLNTLTHSAAELCKAEIGALTFDEGDVLVARGVADVDSAQDRFSPRTPLTGTTAQPCWPDHSCRRDPFTLLTLRARPRLPFSRGSAKALGFRSILFVPLDARGQRIGVFRPGTPANGTILARSRSNWSQTFADQAVIAIENVRLFDEVQAKTRDLTEALTYQTGSANILSVIASSPTDVEPVLKAIVESACELCDAYDADRAV